MFKIRKNKGFTLIELLVVIAIIGILSSVVLASLNTAREKARDARRIADVKQVQIALELFFDDNGNYADTLAELAPEYIPTVPIPPKGAGQTVYAYAAVGNTVAGTCTDYHLGAALEDSDHAALTTDIDSAPNASVCTGGTEFDGNDADCTGTISATPDTCYDLKP